MLPLFRILLQIWINLPHDLCDVCLSNTLVLSKGIGVLFLLPENTLCLQMLHSLRLSTSLIVLTLRLRVFLYSLVESCDTDATDTTTMEKETPHPLQVYHQCQHPPPAIISSTSVDLPPTDLNMPIAIRKGTRAIAAHLIPIFVTYDRLHHAFRTFTLSISS